MQTKLIADVRAILDSGPFVAWHERYKVAASDWMAARRQDEDPLTDAILRAGGYEELAAIAEISFNALDSSFEELSHFESQRAHTSEIWTAWNGAESRLADFRHLASETSRSLDALKKADGNANAAQIAKIADRLEALQLAIERASGDVASRSRELATETARSKELWATVEKTWTAVFRHAMEVVEYKYLARRWRECAGHAPSLPLTPGPSETDARAAFELLVAQAEQRFGAVLVEEFLYWLRTDNPRLGLCVPLVTDRDHLNLQVSALQIYEMHRDKGIEFLEPLPDCTVDPNAPDPRLEAFFARTV